MGLTRKPSCIAVRILQLWLLSILISVQANAQASDSAALAGQVDVRDVIQHVFKLRPSPNKQTRTIAILPSLGYNPSMGGIFGANITAGKFLGPSQSTTFSTLLVGAQITTKGIITAQLRHNVFTSGNKWNLIGNIQLSRMVQLDYGLGTGKGSRKSDGFSIIGFGLRNTPEVYPLKFTYIRLNERAYRKVANHWYAGGGIALDIRTAVTDEKLAEGEGTPQFIYSQEKGINWKKNAANGLLLNVQFNNREHPNRSYGGMLADVVIRSNQRWMGSTRNALQLNTEWRKYWSLSRRHPETVLAFWHWGSYLLSGTLPYLEMPATASDIYNRSGRAYTIGRFRGPSFLYLESELRFPILANKLISGVAFANWQSASNNKNLGLMQRWEPGAGMGLRFLFNKNTRTNLCLDYAVGRYGASGIFLGLNEAF